MPIFNTQPASLSFKYGDFSGDAISNSTDNNSKNPITITKESTSSDYFLDDKIDYIICITNQTDFPTSKITIKENLGTYDFENNSKYLTPLTYINFFKYYVNGISTPLAPPETYPNKIIFSIDSLAPMASSMIIYSAKVNSNTPLEPGSTIKNISSVTVEDFSDPIKTFSESTVKLKADVKIIKQLEPPATLTDKTITYTFLLSNYGNTEASDVVLNDKLVPTISNMQVLVNSKAINFSDYSYIDNSFRIPSYNSNYNLNIPRATFNFDPKLKKMITNPGIIKIEVKGKI